MGVEGERIGLVHQSRSRINSPGTQSDRDEVGSTEGLVYLHRKVSCANSKLTKQNKTKNDRKADIVYFLLFGIGPTLKKQ